ncbi:N-acetylmuramoyl-L-alanine amidase [Streptomyces sp. G1]|uniref:peptidoglycan recognition protein family protein n=1 Tax=Streptomyces sp. G1 TaxID=361572 RepID=UPI002030E6C2|nr:N-acetylmuramoyl-L-alanine amidase [Streptomyces sp. G1]MCM1972344.1 N-acetylmuramoyl-L-alanine amidase [Streptomyces sp. G1]
MATPLTADRLVAALRAEGVTVREVSGWRTNNRNHKGAWGPVHGVIVHHTVTGPGTDVVGLVYRGHSELPGPLATGCITKDGTVHLTGNGRVNHAGGGDSDVLAAVIGESYGNYPPPSNQHDGSAGAVDGNARFYGWECENKGDGRDPWPRVQYVAIVKATAAVCRAHGWSAKSAIGHLEWSDWKVDPRGFDMKDFRRDLAACLALPAGAWNSEGKDEEDEMALTSDDVKKLWGGDLIPAVEPPYNNADWNDGNTTWTAKYALHAAVAAAREARARTRTIEADVAEIKETVASLSVGGVDLDALAARVAPLLAAELANRLAE